MDFAVLILRIALGTMFMAHGLQKAFGLLGGSGIEKFSGMLSGLGFHPALYWAYLAAYTELIAGLFVVLGLFTRASSLALLILITVAAVKVHLVKGFFLSSGGFEYNYIIAAVCLALILSGPGKFALNSKF